MSETVKHNPLLAVIDEILRLQSSFESLFAEVQQGADLSTMQKLVLFCIFESAVPLTVPHIGRNLGHPRQLIQRVVNEMVEEGLIEKAANPHHKRAPLLLPTRKACLMKDQAETRAIAAAEAFVDAAHAQRCELLTQELRTLRLAIEAHNDGDGARSPERQGILRGSPWALIEGLN